MEILFLLVFFSVLVAGGFLLAFLWAVRTGQFDDRYTPSIRMLDKTLGGNTSARDSQ